MILSKNQRLRASFNMGAKLKIRYMEDGIGSWVWLPYDGEGFPLEDLKNIKVDNSVKYVVLDSVVDGLTYGIFPSEMISKFIKPYCVGKFDKCFDWVIANTKWNEKTEKLFEITYIGPGETTEPIADEVAYKDDCSDSGYSTIKHKTDVEMVCKGSKEKCEKKTEEHNSKLYVKLEDDDCAVYKDDIGLYHIESIHKFIIDEDYKQVYTGSYKECKAFIAGATVNHPDNWFVIIDECGEYEILVGKREPNTLVVYEGTAQDCADFTRRFKSWEKYLASFVKTLEKNNIPVDINELTIRHLQVLAKRISGVGIDSKGVKNCPILRLLMKHNFLCIDCQRLVYSAPDEV